MYDASDDTIDIRVQRGLTWIVDHGAEYDVDLARVDVDRIQMALTTECVLGQAAQTEPGGTDVYRYHDVTRTAANAAEVSSTAWQVDHGFLRPEMGDGYSETDSYGFQDLDDAWREAIREHRAAA